MLELLNYLRYLGENSVFRRYVWRCICLLLLHAIGIMYKDISASPSRYFLCKSRCSTGGLIFGLFCAKFTNKILHLSYIYIFHHTQSVFVIFTSMLVPIIPQTVLMRKVITGLHLGYFG